MSLFVIKSTVDTIDFKTKHGRKNPIEITNQSNNFKDIHL